MRAPLDDAAVLEHEDQVGGADGRQPVRDDDRGAALQRLGQRVLDGRLGRGVEVRGRLVEDDDPRPGEQHPGDGQPLPLAARQPVPALADHRVEPVRQRRAPGRPAGRARSASHSSSSVRLRPGEQQVGADRLVEQVAVLGHQTQRGADGRGGQVARRRPPRDARRPGRRRRGGAAAARSWTCRRRRSRPARPSARARPGTTPRAAPRRRRAGRAARPPPATRATPCRPPGSRTTRRRTRPTRARRAAAAASGLSAISGSRSSTSKTRSKLTSALITSTRALASAVSGAYSRVSSRARATTAPGSSRPRSA